MWGSKKTPPKPKTLDQMTTEEVKEFQNGIRKETRDALREIDRQIFNADRLVNEAKRELETKIKAGADKNIIRMYAKNALSAQNLKDKHMIQKTKIQSVDYSVNQLLISMKMSKTMGDATKIIQQINGLANIPEISKNIESMQMQMEKHGIISEMINDAMDELNDDVDIDEKAEEMIRQLEEKNKAKTKPAQTTKITDNDLDEKIKNLSL